MKLKTVPTGVLESILAFGNRLPTPIAETAGALMLARSIESASNLGIFTYLGRRGPSTVSALCAALSLNEQIVGALMHALAGAGYLVEGEGVYRNSPISARFLVEGSPQYIGNFIRYNGQQRLLWLGIEHIARGRDERRTVHDALRVMCGELAEQLPAEGEDALNSHHSIKSPELWRNYMYGLRDLANLSLPELELRLRLPRGVRRLLDVGGGHGAYSIWMCKRNPALKATIFDLEGAAEVGRKIVADEGLSDRIEYVTGDVVGREDFGRERFDVAFCFNLIHHLTPAQNVAMIQKVARSLDRGSPFVVWDKYRDEEYQKDHFARFIGIMFLLGTGGDCYSFTQVTEWMRDAGIVRIKRASMESTPGTALLWGRKA